MERREFTDEDNIRHEFRYGVPLNDTHFDLKVNFHWEKLPNGKKQRFSWVTDLPIDEGAELMRTGRARWKERNFQHPEEPRLLITTSVTVTRICRLSLR